MKDKKRPPKENGDLIGEVVEVERKYVNETEGLVEVSFQIPCHDWKKLKRSIQWHRVEKLLAEVRNKYIRKNRQGKTG